MLKIFNKLLYNYEINRSLVAEFLLDLLYHYIPNISIKSINIFMLKTKFLLLISKQNFNTTNDIACINSDKVQLFLYLSTIIIKTCIFHNILCMSIIELY